MAGFYQLLATTLAMFLCIPLNIGLASELGGPVETKILCIGSERVALLKFKQGYEDTSILFSTWAPGTDCCKWKGVKCNGTTGHVISLDLGLPYDFCYPSTIVHGEINSALLGLPFLTYLDLSCNDFHGSQLPAFLGSLNNLQHLNLSYCKLEGTIPDDFRNLSHLKSLNLSRNYDLRANSLEWLYNLSSLKILDLNVVNLNRTADSWIHAVQALPSLEELHLRYCQLKSIPPSLPQLNCSSLVTLDLSENDFNNSAILDWVFQYCHNLRHLDLSYNFDLRVNNLEWLNNLSSLKVLNLNRVNLNRTADNWIHTIQALPSLEELHLQSCRLQSIPPSISQVNCSSLVILDLFGNDFNNSAILDWVFQYCRNLSHLDLSYNYDLRVSNLEWLNNLSSLKVLDLSNVNLNRTADNWIHAVQALPFLEELHLRYCQLQSIPPSISQVNCSSLVILDLSGNDFNNSVILDWVFQNCHNLSHLDLSYNELNGEIPALTHLSNTSLSIPKLSVNQLGIKSSLRELHLSHNHLNGMLKSSLLQQLSQLIMLDVSFNDLEGVITNVDLDNFYNLKVLDLSENHFIFNITREWIPPFQLETIGLSHCQLGPQFPKWIQTQRNFLHIDISDNNISGIVPDWFWNLSPIVEYINLSYNELRDHVPDLSSKMKLQTLDLSNNNFTCPLPKFPQYIKDLNLARNSFFNPITNICNMGISSLVSLDLSSNNFSGNLPDCWTIGTSLVVLRLADNHFIGSIPQSFGAFTYLLLLSLNNNNFSGNLPLSMKNCTRLVVFDVGHNKLSGTIPAWIENMEGLYALQLSSNAFEGNIPGTLCNIKSLHILDFSFNQLSGPILQCIFAAMATKASNYSDSIVGSMGGEAWVVIIDYNEDLLLTWKGKNLTTFGSKGFWLLKALDLSSNLLTGGIPEEIIDYVGLKSLNLSRNQLEGTIPSNIGNMESLEELDLSWNNLTSIIPISMIGMDQLGVLDVSHNNLTGQIPWGRHFDTFDASSFMDNPNLCGPPLNRSCTTNNLSRNPYNQEKGGKRDVLEIFSFYISMVIGFVIGFWAICGPLLVSRSWRQAYFQFLSHMYDKIYVMVATMMAKMRRRLQG